MNVTGTMMPNQVLQFTASSPGATSYSWNFGDGYSSILQNPSHTYGATGIFIVTLVVQNATCTVTKYDTLNIGVIGVEEVLIEDGMAVSPNPFSDETRIGVTLPENLDVTLKIYDINGRTIYQTTKQYAKGSNEILINANMINANGVLYYEVSTKYGTEMRKMIRLKN